MEGTSLLSVEFLDLLSLDLRKASKDIKWKARLRLVSNEQKLNDNFLYRNRYV